MNMRQRKRHYFRKLSIFPFGPEFAGEYYYAAYSSQYTQGKKVLYV